VDFDPVTATIPSTSPPWSAARDSSFRAADLFGILIDGVAFVWYQSTRQPTCGQHPGEVIFRGK
jgi:hypothetical protein